MDVIDRYRQELNVDYIDCLLIHCMIEENWNETHKRIMNALEEAKQKKIILSHGISCHSFGALTTSAKLNWVDVNLVRINPQAVCIDNESGEWLAESRKEDLPFITKQIRLLKTKYSKTAFLNLIMLKIINLI